MRNRTGWMLALAGVLIFSGPVRLRAQDVDQVKEDPKAIKAMVEESIGWYQVFSNPGASEAMKPQPVLRWHNPSRGGMMESEGVFVLWVNKGRPEASASMYPWHGWISHEVVSLSRDAKLVAREGSQVIWSPLTPGVAFKEIPGAPTPADTPSARLRQMKALTDRFKVTMTGWRPDRSDREELRMLPKPLYRAELGKEPGPDPDWIDGGVFAYVQGTDPEAILMLEVVRQNGRPRWQYGFARATAAGLEARLDKTIVWELEFQVGDTMAADKPQRVVSRKISTIVSGHEAAPAAR